MISQKGKLFLFISILTAIVVMVGGTTTAFLYVAEMERERERLVETAKSQAKLVEAVARFDDEYRSDNPEGTEAATLRQLFEGRKNYMGFGMTGEFTLARRVGDHIIFLLSHRHDDLKNPLPLPFDSGLAEPMKLALAGRSGTIIGLDYRGETVLAAYEPVAVLNLGLVAKIDLAEIRKPFIKAGLLTLALSVLAILSGTFMFLWAFQYLTRALHNSEQQLKEAQLIAGIGYWRVNPSTGEVDGSDELFRIFDLPREEATLQAFAEVVHEDDREYDLAHIQRGIDHAESWDIEHRIVREDGSVRIVNARGQPVTDKNGQTVGLVGIVQDITERKQAEEEIRLHSAIIKDMAEGVFLFRASDGEIIYSNPRNDELFGYDPDELTGNHVSVVNAPYERTPDETAERIIRSLKETGSWKGEVQNIKKDGTIFWCHAKISTMEHLQFGTIWISVNEDITEQKRVEEELRESRDAEKLAHARLMDAIESLPASFALYDTNDRLVMVNKKTLEMFPDHASILKPGTTYEEVIRRSFDLGLIIFNPQQKDALVKERVREHGAIQNVFEQEWVDGRWFEVHHLPMNNRGTVSIRLDITERKQAEKKLQESRRLLQNVFDTIPHPLFVKDQNSCYLLVNQNFVNQFDNIPEDWLERSLSEVLIYPETMRAELIEQDRRVLEFGESIEVLDYPVEEVGGETHFYHHFKEPLRDETGNIIGLIGFGIETTERKKAEVALLESRTLLRSVVDTIQDWVVAKDRDGKYLMVNQSFADFVGLPPGVCVGQSVVELPLGTFEEKRKSKNADRMVYETGQKLNQQEVPLTLPSGEFIYKHVTKLPIMDEGGTVTGMVEVTEDVTERKQLEEHLRHSQKLEAIGQLAGGVAHEFNNMLQIIHGFTEMAMANIGSPDSVLGFLGHVNKASERAAGLTAQLLAFGRKQDLDTEDIDLNVLIANQMKMLNLLIGVNIDFEFKPSEDQVLVIGDQGMLEQVLMNICINARDAMRNSGRITIETSTLFAGVEFCQTHPWAISRNYTLISIQDTGSGIDPEIIDRIFEPFFTTKDVGEGSGLGLPMAYGIIQLHEGMIEVESHPGKGTTFRIFLPVATELKDVERPPEETSIMGGTETILVAEDEEDVLLLVTELLERHGYTVLAARNGKDALQEFIRVNADIDLAIIDVVMPKMGGWNLYKEIAKIHSSLPVIFCTGYDPDRIDEYLDPGHGMKLIRKPYKPNHLLQMVREALDKRPSN